MNEERKDDNQKAKKKRERRAITSLNVGFYITFGTISLIFILLSVLIQTCECSSCFICTFFEKLLEFIAAGMLPSVLFAFFTDLANTRREQEDYKKKIQSKKEYLREACLNLSSEILVCIDHPEDAEDGKGKTFLEWCKYLCDKPQIFTNESRYYAQSVHEVERAASDFEIEVSVFEKSIFEKKRISEIRHTKKLVMSCKALRQALKHEDKNRFLSNIESLNDAILEMFTETDGDSKCGKTDSEINRYYMGKYNSQTFAKGEDEES